MKRVPITLKGYQRQKAALKRMKTLDRREVAQELEIARAHGDLRENADYDAAKEKQGLLEANIREFEDRLARANVIDISKLSGDRVVFGATVLLYDVERDSEREISIMGEYEADPREGRISINSPLARGLIGKEVDDCVMVQSPGGAREYEILEIRFQGGD